MKRFFLGVLLVTCPLWISSAIAASSIEPGTVVIYSNGLVEKLMSRDEDRSIWETDRKRVYERGHTGFFQDRREERFPTGSRTTIWAVDEQEFAKLAAMGPGSSLEFSMFRTRNGANKSRRIWTCNYDADLLKQVAGNELQTQHFKCTRYSRFRADARVREQREIKYSPDLGVVIWERHKKGDATAREREVVAILPPEKATLEIISEIIKDNK